MLQSVPAVGGEGDVGVEAEAIEPGTPRGGLGRDRRGAEPAHRLAGPRPEGDPALERGGHGAGEQGLLRRERIRRLGVFREAPSADE